MRIRSCALLAVPSGTRLHKSRKPEPVPPKKAEQIGLKPRSIGGALSAIIV